MEVQLDALYKMLCNRLIVALKPSVSILCRMRWDVPSLSSPEYQECKQLHDELENIYSVLVDKLWYKITLRNMVA